VSADATCSVGSCTSTAELHERIYALYERPHRGLALAVPEVRDQGWGSMPVHPGEVRRRDLLSGLIHEYHRVGA
jgi:hypothetical protein